MTQNASLSQRVFITAHVTPSAFMQYMKVPPADQSDPWKMKPSLTGHHFKVLDTKVLLPLIISVQQTCLKVEVLQLKTSLTRVQLRNLFMSQNKPAYTDVNTAGGHQSLCFVCLTAATLLV